MKEEVVYRNYPHIKIKGITRMSFKGICVKLFLLNFFSLLTFRYLLRIMFYSYLSGSHFHFMDSSDKFEICIRLYMYIYTYIYV